MQIKPPDDKTADLKKLSELLKRKGIYPSTKERIEKAMRNIRAGMQGEAEAAYEIDFHYGNSEDWMILHDLRLEHDGRVAQIDHLIINRAMQFWVCESKNFSEGVSFNEYGECVAFRDGKPYGFASPIEQNRKHIHVLQAVLDSGLVKLPKGRFFKMIPELESLILVSKGARITRPKKAFPGLETVIKNEQLKNHFDNAFSTVGPDGKKKRMMSPATLRAVADTLLALHKPIQFNWEAMLRVPPEKKVERPNQTFGNKKPEWSKGPKTAQKQTPVRDASETKVTYKNKADAEVGAQRMSSGAEPSVLSEEELLPLPGWMNVSP